MKFAKIVFTTAGVWGFLVLSPLYFMLDIVGQKYPPPVTHPDFYYGFLGLAIAWQLAFLVIGRDPVRFKPMMVPAVFEKALYVISLLVLLLKFVRILFDFVINAWGASESDIILGVLSLIDVTLTANLVVIVVFSGYENFVSRIDPSGHPDWPEWMTHIDFAGLKQKVLASIVAISAVQVLKAFMNLDVHVNTEQLAWLVGIHVVFVISALLLAIVSMTLMTMSSLVLALVNRM